MKTEAQINQYLKTIITDPLYQSTTPFDKLPLKEAISLATLTAAALVLCWVLDINLLSPPSNPQSKISQPHGEQH
jgi:hypothetical protein